MPLDDVYIHFQYAKQMAVGQFYIYNPGLPPTSGATSFLYPYVLAAGYLLGFQGLNLGLWAMGVGALALAESMWLVYRLVQVTGGANWLAMGVALAFGVNGTVSWHFMSGMETGLVMLLTLGTLYGVIVKAETGHANAMPLLAATLLALVRPEGGLLAIMAVAVVWVLSSRSEKLRVQEDARAVIDENRRELSQQLNKFWMLIPVIAVGVQPLVNWVVTGSAVASGNAAKSVFGTVPFYWDEVVRRIVENFARMWAEFTTGSSPREGMYIAPLLLILAAVGIMRLLLEQKWRPVGLMLIGWLVGGTLMIATLDTAFWHFKRYQMPFIALLFPLGGIAVHSLWLRINGGKLMEVDEVGKRTARMPSLRQLWERKAIRGGVVAIVSGWMLLVSGVTAVQFLRYYGLNVGYIYQQPLQMALWLAANTPTDAVVAVHDVGMMRYMGGRTMLDMVGLTTPGAADYWRNGPGAVAEFLMEQRPDYVASYGEGHGLGLGMIAETSIYGEPLASFSVELDNNANVALATDFQGIYKPEWLYAGAAYQPSDFFVVVTYRAALQDVTIPYQDAVNVGELASEAAHQYKWANSYRLTGFASEVREMEYTDCLVGFGGNCFTLDGGRLINGIESFLVATRPNVDALLITRIHPASQGTFDVFVEDELIATRIIPDLPGNWIDVTTLIPARNITSDKMQVTVRAHVIDGFYEPFYHWIYQSKYVPQLFDKYSQIASFQVGAIKLGIVSVFYTPIGDQVYVGLDWYTDGSAKGDYKVFVHLYDDINQPPVAQTDMRPGNGTLPPGNWLPGVLRDTITVDLHGVKSGTYQVAIGMYDPVTLERLQPTGGDANGRLFIGEVEITG